MARKSKKAEKVQERLFQQGDVLFYLQASSDLPKNLKPVQSKFGRVVFAEGEVTGHHHSVGLEEGVALFEDESGTRWATVKKTATVRHQEHGPVTLTPGTYKIGIVREVDPFAEEVRKVRD